MSDLLQLIKVVRQNLLEKNGVSKICMCE